MTRVVDISKTTFHAVIALTREGDDVVVEENGKPIAKITAIGDSEKQPKERIMGLGSGKGYFMADDFDDELPDEFWGFDKDKE